MTDLVDTDALRGVSARLAAVPASGTMEQRMTVVRAQVELTSAADEVDRLRISDSNVTQQRDQLATALRRSDNENDRLRAVIENAPHGQRCWTAIRPSDNGMKCDCWKAEAL
jgi:uncharacterized membrane protein